MMGDNHCSHVDCTCSEPDRLSTRLLIGTGWTATYCDRHDPLTDPSVSDMWKRVIGA